MTINKKIINNNQTAKTIVKKINVNNKIIKDRHEMADRFNELL